MPEHLYGIRHHGPGSARAVLLELDRHPPSIVLIEGPPEADELVRWAADPGLRPPVALLGYATDDPRRAAFWPFAEFSPEWQAIRWAVAHAVPVRFFDLPYAYRLTADPTPPAADLSPPSADASPPAADPAPPAGGSGPRRRPVDPIGELARAAGYDDAERWWEDVVEHRGMPAFEGIAEAMTAIRDTAEDDPDDLLREAHMRTVLRAVRRTHTDIAVVCGAWHVPALTRKVAVKDDAALLRGRRRARVAFTWVPWTYGRLASASGYGAGVRSPGWYHHLFTTADDVVPRWLVDAAGVLRAQGVPTSSAHVIEATRLAEALAALRGRPLAGLGEVTEAAEAVMCDGDPLRVDLISSRLVVGERLGAVPDDMPAVPLARDLAAEQRAARLKPEASERILDLDLRKPTDLRRSRLLHRLRIIDVPWGEPTSSRRGTGTFREEWRLRWHPEFAVRLIEGSMTGTTVAAAATARVVSDAGAATSLAELTALVETCLLADLSDAHPPVLAALDARAALDTDVGHLMAAIPALARTLRYGDVRRTDMAGLATVTAGLLTRVCAALPAATVSLSDEAARTLRDRIDAVHRAVGLLADPTPAGTARADPDPADSPTVDTHPAGTRPPDTDPAGTRPADTHPADTPPADTHPADTPPADTHPAGTRPADTDPAGSPAPTTAAADASGRDLRERWLSTLASVAARDGLHGLLAGRLTRLLLDAARLDTAEAHRRLRLPLTIGTPPAHAAAWVEGFLADGGLLLVHDEALLSLLDGWLADVPAAAFDDVLPLLRRTFGAFDPGERRAIGDRLAGPRRAEHATTCGLGFDPVRADAALPTLSLLLGTPAPQETPASEAHA